MHLIALRTWNHPPMIPINLNIPSENIDKEATRVDDIYCYYCPIISVFLPSFNHSQLSKDPMNHSGSSHRLPSKSDLVPIRSRLTTLLVSSMKFIKRRSQRYEVTRPGLLASERASGRPFSS
ncbi:hypothetical protein AVEN_176260-1 [Araneus ventricosus]|uniref:Uncharacterized protein n=1 Tax=Araneus ventricosus TaxID=182803 RepID=A0A4Y2U0I8_ARAVE|nr:hypothetical protein AVEN_176260-1 [Araneus ventricosus]